MNIVYLILSYNIPSQHIFFIPLWVWIDFNILFLNWESVEISLRGVWFCFLIWRLLPVSSSQTSSSFVSIIFLIYVDKFTFTNFPWLHTLSILLSDCQHSHMQLLFIIFTYIELEFHFWYIHSMHLGKCIMTCIYHYGLLQSIFMALKILCVLPIQPYSLESLANTDLLIVSIVSSFL